MGQAATSKWSVPIRLVQVMAFAAMAGAHVEPVTLDIPAMSPCFPANIAAALMDLAPLKILTRNALAMKVGQVHGATFKDYSARTTAMAMGLAWMVFARAMHHLMATPVRDSAIS